MLMEESRSSQGPHLHFNMFWEHGDKAHILNPGSIRSLLVGPGEMLEAEKREEEGGGG